MHCLAYSKHLHCRFLVMFEMFVICYLCREAQIASPWSVMSCWSYDVQFCCSSLRVLINMFSSDGVPTSLRMNLMLKCAAAAWIPKNSSNQILTHYQILPWQLPILIQTHYQSLPHSASFASADSPEDRSKKSIPQELPKNPIRQKRRLRMIDEDSDGVSIKVIRLYLLTSRRFVDKCFKLTNYKMTSSYPVVRNLSWTFWRNMVTIL